MPLYRVTAPATAVVSVADMKEHLREDGSGQDDLIEELIAAAVAHIDGGDGWLQRALIDQTWDLKLDRFPSCGFIRIPLPPLIEVVHLKSIDADGVEQTFDDANYRVVGAGGKWPAKIYLVSGESWPTVASQWPEPIAVRFRAGYLDSSESPAVAAVPADIKAAIKLTVGHLYANRESVVIGQTAVELPMAAEALLARYRVYD